MFISLMQIFNSVMPISISLMLGMQLCSVQILCIGAALVLAATNDHMQSGRRSLLPEQDENVGPKDELKLVEPKAARKPMRVRFSTSTEVSATSQENQFREARATNRKGHRGRNA